MPSASGFASSFEEVSAALGLSDRQWRTYSKRKGFPEKGPHGYDLAALAAWRSENVKTQTTGELAAERSEKLRLEQELLQIKIDREKRSVLPRSEVEDLHGRIAQKLRAVLYATLENEMPGKIAGQDALTCRTYGRALADRLMEILSKDVSEWEAA